MRLRERIDGIDVCAWEGGGSCKSKPEFIHHGPMEYLRHPLCGKHAESRRDRGEFGILPILFVEPHSELAHCLLEAFCVLAILRLEWDEWQKRQAA